MTLRLANEVEEIFLDAEARPGRLLGWMRFSSRDDIVHLDLEFRARTGREDRVIEGADCSRIFRTGTPLDWEGGDSARSLGAIQKGVLTLIEYEPEWFELPCPPLEYLRRATHGQRLGVAHRPEVVLQWHDERNGLVEICSTRLDAELVTPSVAEEMRSRYSKPVGLYPRGIRCGSLYENHSLADEVFEGRGAQVLISEHVFGGLSLGAIGEVTDLELTLILLQQLLLEKGVIPDFCPHMDDVQRYRFIRDVVMIDTVHPDLDRWGVRKHISGWHDCKLCELEFAREFSEWG